ncbi:hypothetical protein BAXH7_02155 [Bacillus amyloliquefaciens XH7]|nr:hypothetical protein BAMTA208_10540 [Bacillus amyloliquefaciens TA208]AEB62961.1 hypothetical protein LL3_01420 [Bacillus amyloliquefaciens LL3]AEK89287.1 hypothetical protein BAXH7_02155 [Bacillus amyloliquefaciens XH7]KYC94447.1 hypothetical protein B425_1357 [Bacillus amyloliquefaciens]QBG55755.1 hypothetical protein D2M30_1425 [Bacillus amyloliquefaciens]
MNQHTSFLKRAVTLGVESVNNWTSSSDPGCVPDASNRSA